MACDGGLLFGEYERGACAWVEDDSDGLLGACAPKGLRASRERSAGQRAASEQARGAFNYIRNHWDALNVFVNDGALPIDNNQVERLMKRIAVGRKNWLFIGSLRAGVRNASLMSLVASALRQDLDVAMYLESVITHMLRGTAKLEELLPDRWKAAHPEAVREYRAQERRDKADTAVLQAARRLVRAELRKGK